MLNLCSKCRQADNTCPIYLEVEKVFECVEWRPSLDILMEEFTKMSTQNSVVKVKGDDFSPNYQGTLVP
jgi:Cft2 family RNA processing exonuclease